MNIIVKKKILVYRSYKFKCWIGKGGVNLLKKEGDLSTPKGTFKLGTLYYRKDKVKIRNYELKKKIIKKNMGWCDDVNSRMYNREIIFPFKYSAEKLYRNDAIYDIFIHIKYNDFPIVKNKGSAIFLHIVNKNFKPTKGCVALEKKNLLKLISLINKKTKILIK
jgi:L,D-peptidoglycan transpeptidase YkuD (ErfK/YbiS/YcfS/YnhG family)